MSKLRIQLKALVKHSKTLTSVRDCYSFKESSQTYKTTITNAIHENEREIARLLEVIHSPDDHDAIMRQLNIIANSIEMVA